MIPTKTGSTCEDSSSTPFESSSPPSFQDKSTLPSLPSKTRGQTTVTKRTTTTTSNIDIKFDEAPNDDDGEEEVEGRGNVGLGGRRLTSVVWDHYERQIIGGVLKAICRGCKKQLVGKSSSGTTHLKEHLKRCLKVKKTMDGTQQLLQASVNKNGKSSLKMGKGKSDFDPRISRYELCNMIVLHEYPLAMVDHIGFRRYSRGLNPDFKLISRNTVKADILKYFKEERSQLMKQLTMINSRVAITTDMWTCPNQRKGYMAVTTHFIDDDWVLQNRLIRFMYVPCPHDKETISKALMECLKSFNLDEKVSTITVDNCTTNDAVMDIIREKLSPNKLILGGNYLHMRCYAHILNLVVNDGLDIIKDAIEKVRDVVAYCTGTPKRNEKFEDACNYVKVPITKKLSLDCKTRWNSCYEMLQVALMYKDAFARLEIKVGKRRKDKFRLPSQEEWQMASQICDKLAIFKRTTDAFSGTNYPTANLYFVKVCAIRLELRSWLSCGNKVIVNMAKSMIEKFDKYWSIINVILSVASILDPRKKMDCIALYFNIMYGVSGGVECEKVKNVLIDLVRDYEKHSLEKEPSPSSYSSYINDKGKRPIVETNSFEDLWDQHVSSEPLKKPRKCEVETYLEDPRIVVDDSKFNLLTWWSVESSKFPTLSRIARDLLAVPISTVASESAFSKGGRVVGPHRSRLHPDTVEALMCLQSWRHAQFKDIAKDDKLRCALIYDDEDVEVQQE